MSIVITHSAGIDRNPRRAAVLSIELNLKSLDDIMLFQQPHKLGAASWPDMMLRLEVANRRDQFGGRLIPQHPRQGRVGRNDSSSRRALENALVSVFKDV